MGIKERGVVSYGIKLAAPQNHPALATHPSLVRELPKPCGYSQTGLVSYGLKLAATSGPPRPFGAPLLGAGIAETLRLQP